MNPTTIGSLFTLFSGEEDTVTYQPILTAAALEVTQELNDSADSTDARLNYLAAAIANLRYTQIYGAQEKSLATFAGTLRRPADFSRQVCFARELVRSYTGLCADLLKDPAFVFFGFRG